MKAKLLLLPLCFFSIEVCARDVQEQIVTCSANGAEHQHDSAFQDNNPKEYSLLQHKTSMQRERVDAGSSSHSASMLQQAQPVWVPAGGNRLILPMMDTVAFGTIVVIAVCGYLLFCANKPFSGKTRSADQDILDIQEFYERHETFLSNIQLAAFISFWITVFSYPAYSNYANWWTFGELHRMVGKETIAMCGSEDVGHMVNVGTELKPELVPYNVGSDKVWNPHMFPKDVWCGYLPSSYLGYWPNVIQFVVFSVYQSTGTTIQLVWQGVAGTTCAVFNVWLMTAIFPSGAKSHECTAQEHAAGVCFLGQSVHDDPNYESWICWLDVVVVLFLFLFSNADVNTIKFGMSWHIYFMMNFMNPQKGPLLGKIPSFIPEVFMDGEKTVVMLTTVAGGLIAVLSTLVPKPLLNITHLQKDSKKIVRSLESIWTQSIEYFCGESKTAKRYLLDEKIQELSVTISKVKGNLDSSWWETFHSQKAQVRSLFKVFDTSVVEIDDVMYALQNCVQHEDFGGAHPFFSSTMKESMLNLKTETVHLLKRCTKCFKDGKIDQEEEADIRESIGSVKHRQTEMHDAFMKGVCEHQPYVSIDLANENIFIFALSAWARKTLDFAEKFFPETEQPRVGRASKYSSFAHSAISHTVKGLQGLWSLGGRSPKELNDHLRFCFTNLATILTCFVFGYYVSGSVYKPYSSIMPSTVALLVAHSRGGAFERNLHRLLGVTLGKVLPILAMAVVGVNSCKSPAHLYVYMIVMLLFMFIFNYIYYTSPQWNIVGCLVAGFSCYGLLRPCHDGQSMKDVLFSSAYAEIGQVTTAIVIQLVLESILIRQSPRDVAVQSIPELQDAYLGGFQAFFDGDMKKMEAQCANAKSLLAEADALAPCTDPYRELAPSWKIPFRKNLYSNSLKCLRGLLSDLSMLCLAMKFRRLEEGTEGKDEPVFKSRLLAFMCEKPSMSVMRTDLLGTLENCFQILRKVLAHTSEGPIDDEAVQALASMRGMLDLAGVDDMYQQANDAPPAEADYQRKTITEVRRVRLTVIFRSLRNATKHSGQILMLCSQEDIFD